MNSKVILVTGGGRSGKSMYAQRLAESLPAPRFFLATCPVIDEEMNDRIRKHQAVRAKNEWQTVEETMELARVIETLPSPVVVLVDCLTLWVNNLMFDAQKRGEEILESDVMKKCHLIMETLRRKTGTFIFVTNEVGMGIIPENPVCRIYRDLAGRVNQSIADNADEVVLMVCGQALKIKS